MKMTNILPRISRGRTSPSCQRQHAQGLSGIGDRLGHRLASWLIDNRELQVWKEVDPHGQFHWRAYDPVSGRSHITGSEEEMRTWIEQRYYVG